LKTLKIILRFKYLIFILILFLSLFRSNIKKESIYNLNQTKFFGTIIDYKIKDNYITFTLKSKEKLKCNYYLKNNEAIRIKYGDNIILEGILTQPSNNTIFNVFNYRKYLNYNDIYYVLNVTKIVKLEESNNLFYKIKNSIIDRINKIDNTGYLKTFILGNKNDIDNDIYETYINNGVVHIFSISGMHISILASIIMFLLNKIKKRDYNVLFVILFLLFYLILTNYQASIVRSIVFFIVLHIFKLFKINVSTKDSLLLAINIILFINPMYLYNIGFLYSSIISFTLILYSNKLKNKYIINLILISLISLLVSLPITINSNYQINLLSIFINAIFVPLISFILYPLSLLTFFFVFLYPLFNFLITVTELVSNYISKLNYLVIFLPKLNIINIVIYYILLYITMFKRKKYFVVLIMYFILIKNVNVIDSNYYVYFNDVGQGDMIVIKNKSNAILIDTGCSSYNASYKISDNYFKFLYSIGINNIDTLILSHGDYDHMGEAINLVENFKVEKVIFNCGEFNDLEQDLIKVLDKKKIPYYSCIKELNIDDNKLYFLNNKDYSNENDNSSVIYTELNNHKFLFMGDAGVDVEEDLIEKYNLQDIDVLKVGHHGSKTSSSKEFISEINPKYSIVSVGKNNRYGHPNEEVLENLEDSKIYRTDQDGSIMFKIKNNKLKIETCSP